MRMALDGRGSHSFSELKKTGERLCDASTLVFCLIAMTVLRQHVEPLANLLQDADALSWVRLQKLDEFCHKTAPFLLQSLQHARRFVRLAGLLRPYLARAEMSRFWTAHMISSRARSCPKLWANLHDLVLDGSFKQCDLLVSTLNQTFAHPACQCYCRRAVPGTHGLARGGGILRPDGRVETTVRGKHLLIPRWVQQTGLSPDSWRHECLAKSLETTSSRWHACNDFESDSVGRGCKVPPRLVAASAQVESGIEASLSFVSAWTSSLSTFSSKVCSSELLQIWQLCGRVFSFQQILSRCDPNEDEVESLVELYRLLKPELLGTLWPEDSFSWSPAEKRWPSRAGMVVMYKRWWKQVRAHQNPFWWDAINLRVCKATDLSDASSWNMSPDAFMGRKRKRGDAVEFQVGDKADVARGCLKGLTVRICAVDACPTFSTSFFLVPPTL